MITGRKDRLKIRCERGYIVLETPTAEVSMSINSDDERQALSDALYKAAGEALGMWVPPPPTESPDQGGQ